MLSGRNRKLFEKETEKTINGTEWNPRREPTHVETANLQERTENDQGLKFDLPKQLMLGHLDSSQQKKEDPHMSLYTKKKNHL